MDNLTPMRCACYARYSTDLQREESIETSFEIFEISQMPAPGGSFRHTSTRIMGFPAPAPIGRLSRR